VDIALVAIAVDPPLSQQDLSLIRTPLDYTPRVANLLTNSTFFRSQSRIRSSNS
jgi:hypothetical protein